MWGSLGIEFRRKKGDERGGKEFHSQTQSLAKDDLNCTINWESSLANEIFIYSLKFDT